MFFPLDHFLVFSTNIDFLKCVTFLGIWAKSECGLGHSWDSGSFAFLNQDHIEYSVCAERAV